ncbi:Uma2 family endonuclease [Desulfobacterales bacterium HSG2]|nr:Uma2 family endonuclease [Desulfobacterales bacterium HSG2]
MNATLKIPEASVPPTDRPAWIPPEILSDWDMNPYAYQTEEELMPAGSLHGELVVYIMGLRTFLKPQDRMLLVDSFLLYRDSQGVKHRIAPDLLVMPYRFPLPLAYDLDTEPPPLAVIEVTSPISHLKDKEENVPFYANLGIPAYLVIDAVTPEWLLREEVGLYLWRTEKGRVRQMEPDREGYLLLPEINMKIRADGYRMIFADSVNGMILKDSEELWMVRAAERLRAETAEKNATAERLRAEAAEKAAEQACQLAAEERLRIDRLAEKLRSLGIDPNEIM